MATIQHIDMVGENYVGYGDIKGTVSILETDAVYAHEIASILPAFISNKYDGKICGI